MKKILLCIIICIVFCTIVCSANSGLIPIQIKRLFHLLTMPDDLYHSIVKDNFLFWVKDFSMTYDIEAKYSDNYAISIVCHKSPYIPSGWDSEKQKYEFKGKLKVQFYYKDKLILTDEIKQIKAIFYVKNDMKYLKKIELYRFNIPLKKRYKNNLSLKLSVIEPDKTLEKYKDSLQLDISVTGHK